MGRAFRIAIAAAALSALTPPAFASAGNVRLRIAVQSWRPAGQDDGSLARVLASVPGAKADRGTVVVPMAALANEPRLFQDLGLVQAAWRNGSDTVVEDLGRLPGQQDSVKEEVRVFPGSDGSLTVVRTLP